MVLFLRNQKRQNLVDIEIFQKDDYVELRSVVLIEPYSLLLLKAEDKGQVITDFEFLSELRGWFWENYCEKVDKVVLSEVVKTVKQMLEEFAKRYELFVVED